MKVLIVKTSSLGDLLHTFPALTDAGKAHSNIRFTWVVEENFVAIPSWHSLVEKTIPVALRRWQTSFWRSLFSKEWRQFIKQLRVEEYDYIIDAQGLLKSALITRLARGPRYGLDKLSARESLASSFYQHRINVTKNQHAITRIRQLFAASLGYELPITAINYDITPHNLLLPHVDLPKNYLIFFHGTTWNTKLYPQHYWLDLIQRVTQQNLTVLLPWGNPKELALAEHLASFSPLALVLPKLNFTEMLSILLKAKAAVSVDTGLGHVAAALGIPNISLYGPTDPRLTGALGKNQLHIAANFPCAPCLQRQCVYFGASREKPACFTTLPPEQVWQQLKQFL